MSYNAVPTILGHSVWHLEAALALARLRMASDQDIVGFNSLRFGGFLHPPHCYTFCTLRSLSTK